MGQKQNTTSKRKWKQLNESERYKIEALFHQGLTPDKIGKSLHRDRRTIERELARGSVEQRDSLWREKLVYFADAGQRVHAANASNKGRGLKIGNDHKLATYIERKIKDEKYSPDAVIGEIKAKGLQFDTSICTKTLYNMIDSNVFMNLSNKDLPMKKRAKKRCYKKVRTVALNNTKGRSIEERPPEIENRDDGGHWEMDCIVGNGSACLLVLVERKTREVIVVKLSAKTQACVIKEIDRIERRYKKRFKEKFKSITMDNGSEFLDMNGIEDSCLHPNTKRTTCYYAHPYSAYERGSNENANRLIRRFVPKGSNIANFTNRDVKRIELWLNDYPRRLFNYKSASQMAA